MSSTGLKEFVKRTPAAPALRAGRDVVRRAQQETNWRRAGRPAPTPPHVKWRALRRAQKRFGLRVFVETGTYQGWTIDALIDRFDRIYSMELHDENYRYCADRFRDRPHVEIIHGNSAEILPDVLARIDQPALLWLDAHYSGEGTASSGIDPIRPELDAVFASPQQHVVYIDDACTFTGADGYPTVDEIRALVFDRRPGWSVTVRDDVIRIEPPA